MAYDPTDETTALSLTKLTRAQLVQLQEALCVSNETVSRLSEGTLRRALRKLDNPDRARAREEFLKLQEVDDAGTIPPNAMLDALKQLDSIRSRSTTPQRVAGVPCGQRVQLRTLAGPTLQPGAGITPQQDWNALGPGNIGGRTRSIIIHPRTPTTIWLGSAGGGVWRSGDGGGAWSPVDDMMANLAVCSMVMDPTNPDTIYAGTGEGFSNVDAIRGAGLFRTTDGITWAQLPATAGQGFHFVNRLALSNNGRVLLAATAEGIFRSTDPARLMWTAALPNVRMADVKCDPNDPNRAVAGGARNGMAYSSIDGGLTWTASASSIPWSGRVELTYAANDSAIVYASVEATTGEVWKSIDGGVTYMRQQALNENGVPTNLLGEQGWYGNVIWAGDPTDANLVVVGGIDLWRSEDGGNNFRRISDWSEGQSVHADHHAIVAHPEFNGHTNRTVFFSNDGGIYKTDNIRTVGNDPRRTQGWVRLVNGYAVTQFYSGVGNANSGTIIGGTQDNGTGSFMLGSGAQPWAEILGGDGGFVATDPGDPNYFYTEYTFLNIHRNTNGATSDNNWWENHISGSFWNAALQPQDWDWKPAPYTIPDAMNRRALFIAPFVLDPNNADRILAGGRSLWRTNDAKTPNTDANGPSWASIKPEVGASISAIAIARGNSDLIWVGYENGEVYFTRNGTDNTPGWQPIDQAGPTGLRAHRYCTRIIINPTGYNTVYVTFGGYVNQNVWKTTDGGQEWSNIGSQLPHALVRCLTMHPRRSDFLYLGTEVGVFTSEDAGVTWSPTNEGPTNCAVYDLFWMNEILVCVTHGRGMFSIDLSDV